MANIQPRYDKNGKLISYSIRVFRGRDADGKQLKPWTATFEVSPTWKEDSARKKAEAYAATFEEKCKKGTISDSRRRFEEYCEYVIQLKESRGTKKSTINWYREQTKRIYPEIGHLKLKDIRVDHLNQFYSKLLETKIEPTSVKANVDLPSILKEKNITRAAIAEEKGISLNAIYACVRGDTCSVKTAKAVSECVGIKFEKSFLVLNESKSLSAKTVSGYHRLISIVLEQAVKEGHIPFNVAAKADIPKVEQKTITSLQTADLPKILNALEAEDLKWRVIVHLLLITGARRGEVLGLRWPSVDLTNNRLYINNNVLYRPGLGTYQDKPKTEKSIRWVNVPSATMDLLREWKEHQKKDAKKKSGYYQNTDQLLFTQDDGSPMCPDSVTTFLNRFSKKNGLPHLNPHKFRHTMASMLIYQHVDPVSVSRRLGHSQVSTTTDIYADVIAEADIQNAEILGDVFLKKARVFIAS